MNMKRKIKFITFNIFILFSIACCIALGLWQVDRMRWKEELIFQVNKYELLNPEEFKFDQYEGKANLFKKVYLYGAFMHDREFLLQAKYFDESRDKKTLGYHVITPFATTENIVVFVNRGWVPEKYKESKNRPESLTPHNLEKPLKAIIRQSHGSAPWYMPQNEPEKNSWFWIDIPEMVKFIKREEGITNVKPILFQQAFTTSIDGFKYPIPISTEIKFYNQHLTYIITWFSLAFVFLAMWYWWLRKQKD